MIILIVSVVILQIWITSTSGSECGSAPSVTLNCGNGSAHVDWAPSLTDCHFDCKAYWACWNAADISDHYERETSGVHVFCKSHWTFNIPWDYYICNVTVFYEYFSLNTFTNSRSPNTIKSCERHLTTVDIQRDDYSEVGSRSYEVNCTISTSKEINSDNVSISWIGPNGVMINESSKITVIPTTSDGYIHTSTLQFSYISEEDENTSYTCTAALSGDHVSKSFTMTTLTFDIQRDDYSEVGRPYEVKCTVSTKNVINSDNVSINWIGHNGAIANDSSRITVIPTTSDGYTHTSTLRFSYISEEDENTSYNCTASLFATETIPKSFNISNLNIPPPNVSIRAVNQTVGNPLSLECVVNAVRGITSDVDILWMANKEELRRDNGNVIQNITTYHYYSDSKRLTLNDSNSVYSCRIIINTSPPINATDSVTLTVETISPSTSTSFPMSTSTVSTPPPSTNADSSNDAVMVISSIAAVVAVGLIICFTGYCICTGKRNFKFTRANSQLDKLSIPPWSIDDDYIVVPGVETSTIDYEYLKSYDKVNKWMEMSTLDEEQSSVYSPSVTNEKMLEMIHGHSRKEHSNTNTVSIHYTQYCNNSESYNTSAMHTLKNDTGYYSGSSEGLAQENGSYISEKAAFSNKENKVTSVSVQVENTHLKNLINEEDHVQFASSQIILSSPIPNADGYVTLESQYQSTDRRVSSPFQILVEETNEDGKSSALSEGDYFPYTTAEIQPHSNYSTSPTVTEERYGNGYSPAISEGEYIPYTSAINQHDPAAETTLSEKGHHMQQNCINAMYNGVIRESIKQGTQITSSLPYVSPDEDDSPHTALDSYIDKPLITTNSNEYDASCTTDNISHSDVSSYTNTI